MLPYPFQQHLERQLGQTIAEIQPVAGGDINQAARLLLADGQKLFLKYNTVVQAPAMFRCEALGLAFLGASRAIATPKVVLEGCTEQGIAYLLLEYLAPGPKTRMFWEKFGEGLAAIHGGPSAWFGLSHDNFIGSLPQYNTRCDNWPEFYTTQRLQPQLQMARDQGLLENSDAHDLDILCGKLPEICPKESPALTHGDLWSGNFLCTTAGLPVLIDPAASYAHREMDLAMSRLFGAFDPAFYAAYEACWPLEPGFEKRIDVYQLYYLLVHVNLFGGNYIQSVRDILEKYRWRKPPGFSGG